MERYILLMTLGRLQKKFETISWAQAATYPLCLLPLATAAACARFVRLHSNPRSQIDGRTLIDLYRATFLASATPSSGRDRGGLRPATDGRPLADELKKITGAAA